MKIARHMFLITNSLYLEESWGVTEHVTQNGLHPLFFLPCPGKMSVSVLSQVCCKEYHSDSLYSQVPGSQPCSKVTAQVVGHCAVRSAPKYVALFPFVMCVAMCDYTPIHFMDLR